jgi:hypothetical protein
LTCLCAACYPERVMRIPSLTPPKWTAPKLSVPGSGTQVCELRFSLQSVPDKAVLMSCAYAFHAVFVNGEFVGSEEFSFVTVYDIADRLKLGENSLKVLVLPHQTDGWFSVDSDAVGADLSTANPGWVWLEDDPMMSHRIIPCVRGTVDQPWNGGGQWFAGLPTRRELPLGVVAYPEQWRGEMFPSGCAVVDYEEGDRISVESELVFDFGRETLGYVEIEVESDRECEITLRYAESFNRLDSHLWFHADVAFHLRSGPNRVFDPSRKAFRYVRVTCDVPAKLRITSIANHRPYREFTNHGNFKCSDEFLNRVNEVSCYTVELCAQMFLEDGIKRDRLCWTGDLRPMAMVMYNQLGDTGIVRDSLYAFASHTNEHGVMQPAYPWRTEWVMTDYVMWWIISLWEYYEHTRDAETLRELAPVAFDQAKWLESKCDERGLMVTGTEDDAPITCWSSRKRDGYTAYHNALWFWTRSCLFNLEDGLSDEISRKDQRFLEHLKYRFPYISSRSFLRGTFVDSGGLWRDLDFDGRFRPEIPHDGSVTAAMAGLAELPLEALRLGWTDFGAPLWWPSGEREPEETDNRIMPLYNAYEIEQRFAMGDRSGALELMRRCFGHMLELGSTTFWECIQMDGKPDVNDAEKAGFVSLCHGWSGYLAAVLPLVCN